MRMGGLHDVTGMSRSTQTCNCLSQPLLKDMPLANLEGDRRENSWPCSGWGEHFPHVQSAVQCCFFRFPPELLSAVGQHNAPARGMALPSISFQHCSWKSSPALEKCCLRDPDRYQTQFSLVHQKKKSLLQTNPHFKFQMKNWQAAKLSHLFGFEIPS